MILTCPSCSASYNVPAEAIGPKGREVRCKKCAHVWFQAGEKKALDDIFTRMESHRMDADDISFADRKKEKRPKGERVPFLRPLVARTRARVGTFFRVKILRGRKLSIPVTVRDVAGVSVSLAVVSVVVLGLVAGRGAIVHIVPSLEGVYNAVGFPVVSYKNINPEEAFVIEHAGIERTGSGRILTGNLINLTSSEVLLPRLRIVFIDNHGQNLAEIVQTLAPEKASLKKEAAFGLRIPIGKDVPDTLTTVEISFAE